MKLCIKKQLIKTSKFFSLNSIHFEYFIKKIKSYLKIKSHREMAFDIL